MIWNFILKNKFIIIFAIAGLIAGFFLNKLANKISEDRIIAALIAEIQSLKNKRITPNEQKYLQDLEAQLYLLKNWDTY